MLADYPTMPTIPVAELQRARDFYEGVLGFQPRDGAPEGVFYDAGGTTFLVYASAYAGTNQGTAMSFQVPPGEYDAEVSSLRGKGLEFQTFEVEGLTWEDGVASFGDMRSLWFADPDGNIISVETSTG